MNDKSRQLTRHYDAYDYELAISFQKDCERFLLKYENVQSLKFSDFAKIWQEMNFTYVYGYVHGLNKSYSFINTLFITETNILQYSCNNYVRIVLMW